MALKNPQATVNLTGDGSNKDYYFNFKIEVYLSGGSYFPVRNYDITVYVDGVKKDYATDYVLVLDKFGYGYVSFNSAPADGKPVKIIRENYGFFAFKLPENSNEMNTFVTVITSGMFCYNTNEIWRCTDMYYDNWQPENGITTNNAWYYNWSNDTNPNSDTDFETLLNEAEDLIGKSNITGFSFHVPWYWDRDDDRFKPMRSILKTTYENEGYIKLYKKAKGSGLVHRSTGMGQIDGANARLKNNLYTSLYGGQSMNDLTRLPLDSSGNPIFGGTPDDDGLKQGIELATGKGYKFIFYSFCEVSEATKPWRGNILPSKRTVPQLLDDIKTQCVFYANKLVAWNLKPYAFITCSEMKLINQQKTYDVSGAYTDDNGKFYFTAMPKWKEIYDAVKTIFNTKGWNDVLVGYSADWSELNGFGDNQGYYWRPLDELVMYQDACFIDAYYPVTEKHSEVYQDYLDGWTNGREWDYYVYDRDAWAKDFVPPYDGTGSISLDEFRVKNLKWWYENTHDNVGKAPLYPRTATAWTAKAKKIFFVETGCPSIDSGATEPNLFFDPDAVQGGIPKGSKLIPNDIVQYYYYKAMYDKIIDGTVPASGVSIWQYDSRPLSALYCTGAFFWGDTYRVPFVHWIKLYTDYHSIMLRKAGIEPSVDLTLSTLSLAELYRIELRDGTKLYLTPYDTNITYDGNVYMPIPVKREKIESNSDLKIDGVAITVGIAGVVFGDDSLTMPQIIDRGFLSNAHVWIYLVNTAQLIQSELLFEGYASGEMSYSNGVLTFACNSILDKLNCMFPKYIYSEFCQHTLYDKFCTVDKAGYAETDTVSKLSNDSRIVYGNVFKYSEYDEGFWKYGEITFTTGDNANVITSVARHEDGYVVLRTSLPEALKTGDTFIVHPGCDLTGKTCMNKFDNYGNFFGFENIPGPTNVYGY